MPLLRWSRMCPYAPLNVTPAWQNGQRLDESYLANVADKITATAIAAAISQNQSLTPSWRSRLI
jgi:hypothetical protein